MGKKKLILCLREKWLELSPMTKLSPMTFKVITRSSDLILELKSFLMELKWLQKGP